jgi:transcription-repair coupling factor (superfamily II helicase)
VPDEFTPAIAVDAEAMVPREFIPEPDVRLEIYCRLARTETIGALENLRKS